MVQNCALRSYSPMLDCRAKETLACFLLTGRLLLELLKTEEASCKDMLFE